MISLLLFIGATGGLRVTEPFPPVTVIAPVAMGLSEPPFKYPVPVPAIAKVLCSEEFSPPLNRIKATFEVVMKLSDVVVLPHRPPVAVVDRLPS